MQRAAASPRWKGKRARARPALPLPSTRRHPPLPPSLSPLPSPPHPHSMSSAGTLYKGALRSKRKNELLDIANALGLSIDEEGAKRDDVENMVKSHLLDNRAALHSHPAWAGLYHSIDQSDKRAARSSSTAMSP